MKKIYLFIFLIVIGLSQNQSVKANSTTLPSNKLFAPPGSQTITFTPFTTTQTFGNADVTLTATATSGFAVSFSSSNTNVATIVNNKIHLIGPGTATITASQAGDGVRFNAAPNVTQNLTVNVGAQAVITAASFPAATPALQSADLALPAASQYTSAIAPNNPIIYTITAGTAATIVNGRLHMLGTGAVTIQATQPGNGRFADAAPVNATYTIGVPAAPSFANTIGSKAVGIADFDPGATISATGWVSTITYTNTSTAPGNTAFTIVNNKVHLLSAVASTQITATLTYPIAAGGTGTVTATNTSMVITAAAAPAFTPVLTFTSPGSKAYTNVDIPLTATSTSTSGAPITFSITGGTPGLITIVNNNIRMNPLAATPVAPNNTVTITADQGGVPAGVAGLLPADVPQTLTITAPTIGITNPGTKLSNSPDFFVATTATLSNIPVTVSVSPASLATMVNGNVHLTGATGTVTITATQAAAATAAGYPPPADQTATFAVNAATAPPVITFAAIGSRAFTNSDISTFSTSSTFTPLATSTSTSTNPITFTSSNPAVAIVTNILTLGAITPGTGYTNGTYNNVPLTGGSGTGVLATVVVANGVVSTVTIPTPIGAGYLVGDILSASAANLGGTGSGFSVPVLAVAGNFHFVSAPAAPNNTTVITASQGGGTAGTLLLPPDVPNLFTVTPPQISFPTIGTKAYTSIDFAPGATSNNTAYPVYYTSSNPAVATVNNVITGTLTGGTGYTSGTYSNIALTGLTGTGANAVTLVVTSGAVASLTVNSPTAYAVGDVLTLATPGSIGNGTGFQFVVTGISSSVVRFNRNVPVAPNNTSVITASQGGGVNGIPVGYLNSVAYLVKGTGYTNGTYGTTSTTPLVPLTGGTGTGALATVTVTAGGVSAVNIINGGSGYSIGDVLSCAATSIGGTGTGFSVTVTNITAIPADVSQVLTVTAPAINFPPLGSKPLTSTDLNPGATGAYLSTNSIATVTLTAGSGYANGVYYAVPLTGGSGTGATANVNVLGGVVTSVQITNGGSSYVVGNVLTTANTNLGGTGSGFSLVVSAVSASLPVTYTSSNPAVATIVNNFIHFVGTGTTNITASQNGPAGASLGTLLLPQSVTQQLIVTAPVITFAPIATRSYGSLDINPGATSPITSVPINYSSSNTAVAVIDNNGLTNGNNLVKGTGYVGGIYTNVPLTGGTGTGATATITVDVVSQNFISNVLVSSVYGVTGVTITAPGSGYTVGDVVSANPANLGGTPVGSTTAPSGFSFTVTTIGSFVHLTGSGTTNITATQGGGATGTSSLPADVTQTLTVTPPAITFPPLASTLLTSTDINPGATSTLTSTPISYTITPAATGSSVATILTNSITSFTPVNGFNNGGNYVIGTYAPVPLSYPAGVTGTGTGATAQIVVIANSIASVTIISGGTGYKVGDILTCPTSLIGGGTGSGFYATVASVGGAIHLVGSPASPNNTITVTASQGGGATGTAILPADVSQTLTVLPYAITMPALQSRVLSNSDIIVGASSTLTTVPVTYTSSNLAVATIVGGNIHTIAAGTTTITASQGGGATGTATLPPDVTRTLTVTAPAITFQALPTVLSSNTTDIVPVASSTVANIPITYTSSNTAVATIVSGNVLVNGNIHMVGLGTSTITASQGGGATGLTGFITGLGTIVKGSGYTANVYTNVPLTGGTGTGAKATVTTANGSVSSVTLTAGGSGYLIGDLLSAAAANIGGTGTGFTVAVANTTALPADVTQLYTAVQATITFPALGSKAYSNVDVSPGASSPLSATSFLNYTSSNPAVATINYYPSFSTPLTGGSGYANGTYLNVPMIVTFHGVVLPSPGIAVNANVVVSGGIVTSATPVATTNPSSLPPVGSVLTILTSNIGGGTGSGFSTTVTSDGGFIHYTPGTPAAPNNTTTITAIQPLSGMPNATSTLTVTAPAITFPAIGSVAYTNVDLNPGATSSVNTAPITYTSSNTAVATIVNGQIHFVKAGTTDIEATQQNSPVGTLAPATGTLPADVKQTITVTGGPAITFAALGSKALSSTDLAPGATSTYTNAPITYTSSNTAVATIVNGNIHFIATGTTNITASQGGGATGTAILPADQTVALTVIAPTITFTLASPKNIQSVDLAPGATSTVTGVPITYTSSDATIATIVNGNIHFTGGIGTVVIRATQQNTPATSAAAPATSTLPADQQVSLVVNAPVITFASPGSKAFAVTDFIPGATSTLSTLPITYTSSDPNVATIVNGNIHYTGLGITTIVASQQTAAIAAGFPAPPDVAQTLTVVAPTLTFTALGSKAYSSSDLSLIGSVTSSLNQTAPVTFTSSDPTVATIVNNQLHYVGIGSCIITATQASYPGAGAPLSATSALTVTPATISLLPTTAFGTITLGTSDVAFTSTSTLSTNAVPITYTTSDPNVATIVGGNTLHYVSPGTCTITASQVTGANYAPIPQVGVVTLINTPQVATPVITFPALGTRQYTNNGDIVPAATCTNASLTISYTSSNPAVATIVNGNIHLTPPSVVNGVFSYPNPNTTIITATVGGGLTGVPGQLPADVSTVLTVTPGGIVFPALGVQKFSNVDLPPGATSTITIVNSSNVATPITYTSSDPTVATIVNGNIHFVGLGSTTITASLGNVLIPDVSQNLQVVAPVITFTNGATRSIAFQNADVAPGATSTLTTAPITYTSSNPAIVSIVNGNLHFNGIGVVTITASQAAIGNSTTPVSVAQVLTVTAPTLTFTATRTQAFSLTDLDPGATSTLTSVPITYTSSNPAVVSIVNNKLHFNIPTSNLTGNTAIITAIQAGTSNIPTQTAPQTLTVGQFIYSPNGLTKAYGDPDFSPDVSNYGSGYPVTYALATASPATNTAVLTIGANGSGLHITGPGSTNFLASQAGDASASAVAAITQTLTVTQAPLTITPKNVTVPYGSPLIPFPLIYDGFKSTSGNVPLDDSTKFTTQPVVSVVLPASFNGKPGINGSFGTIPAGTYTLTAGGAVSTLYTFTYGTGTLTIVPAVQTLTWTGASTITKLTTDANFDPLARSTGDPIVYTSSNPAVATIVNGQVHIVGIVGTATITATLNATSGNYTGTATLSKVLTVVPGTQTITVANIPVINTGAANYSPNAVASSGLPVTITSADPTIVKVVGNTIQPLHVGTTLLTFSQAGNATYQAAANVVLFVQVTDPSGQLVKVDQAVSPNGDGQNDFLYIEGLQNYPDNHVKIINRNGDKVYGHTGYNNKDIVFTGKDDNGHQLPAGTYFYLIDWNTGSDKNHITGYFVLKY